MFLGKYAVYFDTNRQMNAKFLFNMLCKLLNVYGWTLLMSSTFSKIVWHKNII